MCVACTGGCVCTYVCVCVHLCVCVKLCVCVCVCVFCTLQTWTLLLTSHSLLWIHQLWNTTNQSINQSINQVVSQSGNGTVVKNSLKTKKQKNFSSNHMTAECHKCYKGHTNTCIRSKHFAPALFPNPERPLAVHVTGEESCRGWLVNSFMTYLLPGGFPPLTWPARSLMTVADVAIMTFFRFILPAVEEWMNENL